MGRVRQAGVAVFYFLCALPFAAGRQRRNFPGHCWQAGRLGQGHGSQWPAAVSSARAEDSQGSGNPPRWRARRPGSGRGGPARQGRRAGRGQAGRRRQRQPSGASASPGFKHGLWLLARRPSSLSALAPQQVRHAQFHPPARGDNITPAISQGQGAAEEKGGGGGGCPRPGSRVRAPHCSCCNDTPAAGLVQSLGRRCSASARAGKQREGESGMDRHTERERERESQVWLSLRTDSPYTMKEDHTSAEAVANIVFLSPQWEGRRAGRPHTPPWL